MRRGLVLLLALQNFLSLLGNVTQYMFFLKSLQEFHLSGMWMPLLASITCFSYLVSTLFVNYPLIERFGRLTTGISASVVIGISLFIMTGILFTKSKHLLLTGAVLYSLINGSALSMVQQANFALAGTLAAANLVFAYAALELADLAQNILNLFMQLGLWSSTNTIYLNFPIALLNVSMVSLHCCFKPEEGE